MQNTKQGIVAKLSGDATLVSLLGGQNLFFHRPPVADGFQVAGAGTIAVSLIGNVTGSGTTFLSDFQIGDPVTANGETHVATVVTSDTAMQTDGWAMAAGSLPYTRGAARISFFMVAGPEDPTVPLFDETFQIDIWSRSGDRNDRIAAQIRALLHKQPLTLPAGRLANCLLSNGPELFEDETRIHHKVLSARVLSYPA